MFIERCGAGLASAPVDNDPVSRLDFFLTNTPNTRFEKMTTAAIQALRERKFAVNSRMLPGSCASRERFAANLLIAFLDRYFARHERHRHRHGVATLQEQLVGLEREITTIDDS